MPVTAFFHGYSYRSLEYNIRNDRQSSRGMLLRCTRRWAQQHLATFSQNPSKIMLINIPNSRIILKEINHCFLSVGKWNSKLSMIVCHGFQFGSGALTMHWDKRDNAKAISVVLVAFAVTQLHPGPPVPTGIILTKTNALPSLSYHHVRRNSQLVFVKVSFFTAKGCLLTSPSGCSLPPGLCSVWFVLLVALLWIKTSLALALNHLNTQMFLGEVHREGQRCNWKEMKWAQVSVSVSVSAWAQASCWWAEVLCGRNQGKVSVSNGIKSSLCWIW